MTDEQVKKVEIRREKKKSVKISTNPPYGLDLGLQIRYVSKRSGICVTKTTRPHPLENLALPLESWFYNRHCQCRECLR